MATPEIDRLLNRKYDSFLSYHMYFESSNNLLLYELMMPLVQIVINVELFDISPDLREEVQQSGLIGLYDSLSNRRYRPHEPMGPDHFNTFFYTAVKRHIFGLLADIRNFIPLDGSEMLLPPPRFPHPHDVLNHRYLEQLPALVRIMVIQKLRFQGNELIACKYILDRVLKSAHIALSFLKRELRIKDPKFFIDYILVLVRHALYKLKSKSKGRPHFTSTFDYSYGPVE